MNTDHVNQFNDPTRIILVMLVAFGLIGAWNYARSAPGIDYYVSWVAADATRHQTGHKIYEKETQFRLGMEYRRKAQSGDPQSRQAMAAGVISIIGTSATPFLYSVINLFSTGDYETDLSIWQAISLASFTAAILLFGRLLGFSLTANLAILLPCLVWMAAFHSDLRVANVNSFQLGMIGLALWFQSRDSNRGFLLAAGALLAMIVLFKPNLAPVPVLLTGAWLIRGQYEKLLTGLAGMVAGTVFAVSISSWFFGGPGIWAEWFHGLMNLMSSEFVPSQGNFKAVYFSGLDLSTKGQAALALLFCALTLGALWWGRKRDTLSRGAGQQPDEQRELIEYAQLYAMGCLIQMFVSSLVWLHYYLLVIPMLLVAFRPWSEPSARGAGSVVLHRILPALALLLVLDGPVARLFASDPAASSNLANTFAASILFLLGLWQLRFQDARVRGYS